MASSFPGAIDSFTTKVDGIDDILAAHVNDLQDAVVATQNFLSLASGWTPINPPPTYVSETSIQFTGIDLSQLFPFGTRIKLTQTTDKYFYVISAVYSGGNTTLTLTGGSDYSVANAAITEFWYSHGLAYGFPEWFNWTPTYSALAPMTFTSVTTQKAVFMINGHWCTVQLRAQGTTGGSASRLLLATTPVTAASVNQTLAGFVVDGSSTAYFAGIIGLSDTNNFSAAKGDYSNFGLGTTRLMLINGTFQI